MQCPCRGLYREKVSQSLAQVIVCESVIYVAIIHQFLAGLISWAEFAVEAPFVWYKLATDS